MKAVVPRRNSIDLAALLQPIRHNFQLGGGTSETPYRLVVPARWYSYIVGFVADINTGGFQMYHLHAEYLHSESAASSRAVAGGSSHSNSRALKGGLLSGFSSVAWLSC